MLYRKKNSKLNLLFFISISYILCFVKVLMNYSLLILYVLHFTFNLHWINYSRNITIIYVSLNWNNQSKTNFIKTINCNMKFLRELRYSYIIYTMPFFPQPTSISQKYWFNEYVQNSAKAVNIVVMFFSTLLIMSLNDVRYIFQGCRYL